MDRLESMLFENTILPVMNFNLNKYEEKCEHNRNAGKKGGRPKKETIEINPLSLVETHNNPSGYFNNPENPKDKDKVREKDKAIDKSENEILDTISRSNHEIKNNFEKVYNIDFALISDKQTKYFCYDVAEVVNKLVCDRFMFLLHSSGSEIIASTLTEYGFPELKEKMLGVKRNYKFFFNKLPLNLE